MSELPPVSFGTGFVSLSAAQEAALLAHAHISIALPLPLPEGTGEVAGEEGEMGAEPALALAVRRLRRRLRGEAEEPLLPADPQLKAEPDAGAEEAEAAELRAAARPMADRGGGGKGGRRPGCWPLVRSEGRKTEGAAAARSGQRSEWRGRCGRRSW